MVTYGIFIEKADEPIDAEVRGQKIIFALEDGAIVSTPFEFKPKFQKPAAATEVIDEKPKSEENSKEHETKEEPKAINSEKTPETPKDNLIIAEKEKINRPKIMVMVRDLGLNDEVTMKAINDLPKEVIIGLSPYGSNVDYYAIKAIKNGHKVILNLPTETTSYPVDDPGPHALLDNLPVNKNLERLEWVIRQSPNISGLYVNENSNFLRSQKNVETLISFLEGKNLAFINNGQNDKLIELAKKSKLEIHSNYVFLDSKLSVSEIKKQFQNLQKDAKNSGFAIASIGPYPVAISALAEILAKSTKEEGVKLISLDN